VAQGSKACVALGKRGLQLENGVVALRDSIEKLQHVGLPLSEPASGGGVGVGVLREGVGGAAESRREVTDIFRRSQLLKRTLLPK
jgi:hypothetical protein